MRSTGSVPPSVNLKSRISKSPSVPCAPSECAASVASAIESTNRRNMSDLQGRIFKGPRLDFQGAGFVEFSELCISKILEFNEPGPLKIEFNDRLPTARCGHRCPLSER